MIDKKTMQKIKEKRKYLLKKYRNNKMILFQIALSDGLTLLNYNFENSLIEMEL